jgi:hydroxylysine kinase
MNVSPGIGGLPSVINPSLLNAPPNVDVEDVQRFVKSHYGIVGRAKPLSGERDRTFHISGEGGADYVFKVAHPDEEPDVTDLQISVLLYLATHAQTLPTQRVIACLEGRHEARFLLPDGRSSSARLLSFIPGELLRFSRRSSTQRRNVGRLCADLGRALREFDHPATRQTLAWDLARAGQLRPLIKEISKDSGRAALLSRCLDNFDERVAPALSRLRAQAIHNDFNRNNIVVSADDHDQIVAIIDFGDMVHTALVNDVAIGAANQLEEAEPLLDGSLEFIAGYHEVTPLTGDEIALLHDLISVRVAMSILITEWRGAQFPERRDHITRNTSANWIRLERLSTMSRKQTTSILHRVCKHNG